MLKEDVEYSDNGNIIDCLTRKEIQDTPEERVRQRFIRILQSDYGYPPELMRKEVPIQSGSKILLDADGNEIRADIVVYASHKAAIKRDQGNILFVVECKKPNSQEGYAQLVSYVFNTSAAGGVWTNGNSISVFRKKEKGIGLEQILAMPKYKTDWKSNDSIPDKQGLPRPHNIRFLLSACHNKLYGHGMENEDFDLAMDMVRILLAKIQDETTPGRYPRFWVTEKDYETTEGRNKAADIIQNLFREYADQFPDVFDQHEKIQVGNDSIVEAAGILQNWNLAAKNDDAEDWDIMGETYEQFTHINLKRQYGQFFTNRLVVEMMVQILDPKVGETYVDC